MNITTNLFNLLLHMPSGVWSFHGELGGSFETQHFALRFFIVVVRAIVFELFKHFQL